MLKGGEFQHYSDFGRETAYVNAGDDPQGFVEIKVSPNQARWLRELMAMEIADSVRAPTRTKAPKQRVLAWGPASQAYPFPELDARWQ